MSTPPITAPQLPITLSPWSPGVGLRTRIAAATPRNWNREAWERLRGKAGLITDVQPLMSENNKLHFLVRMDDTGELWWMAPEELRQE